MFKTNIYIYITAEFRTSGYSSICYISLYLIICKNSSFFGIWIMHGVTLAQSVLKYLVDKGLEGSVLCKYGQFLLWEILFHSQRHSQVLASYVFEAYHTNRAHCML